MKNQLHTQQNQAQPDELKRFEEAVSTNQKPTYIYTEEDLGEGLLEMGI